MFLIDMESSKELGVLNIADYQTSTEPQTTLGSSSTTPGTTPKSTSKTDKPSTTTTSQKTDSDSSSTPRSSSTAGMRDGRDIRVTAADIGIVLCGNLLVLAIDISFSSHCKDFVLRFSVHFLFLSNFYLNIMIYLLYIIYTAYRQLTKVLYSLVTENKKYVEIYRHLLL